MTNPWPVPPPRSPETTWHRPLLWTGLFSFLASAALVAMLLFAAVVLIGLLLVLMGAFSGEPVDFFGSLFHNGFVAAVVGGVAVTLLAAGLAVWLASAVVLCLLRLHRPVRRWAPPLQAISACAVVYLFGSVLLTVAPDIAALLNR
ncbi:hypothetical protein [Nocardioides sp. AE5]|uniref:hypothetical protein n=1 Tax=Nocardioides sp. AE5 TaxID=2962573 RepID=UPI0028812133|nr:hypothetical protein [Nocardioides sp. AE5]MDT0201009.1 hypothetical protein [Nocardioides sp. AE5]